MDTKNIAIGIVTLLIGLVIGALAFGGHAAKLGTTFNAAVTETNPYWFYNGLKAGTASQFIADKSGAVTTTGGITTNTLASSRSTLCFDFYATSTATQDHMTASTTGSLPAGAAGVMTFDYGSCP